MTLHLPARPSWRCRACDAPWPCEPACQHLAVEYRDAPASRHTFLADMAALAAFDLCGNRDEAAEAVERILAARTDA